MSEFKKQQKKRKKLKIVVAFGLFFIVAAGFFYFLILSPYTKVNKISVFGAKKTDSVELQKKAEEILQGKILNRLPIDNLIFLPEKKISEMILANFPEVAAVSLVKKISAHTLEIHLSEREPAAIWCRVAPKPVPSTTSSTTVVAAPLGGEIPVAKQDFSPEVDKCFFIDQTGFAFRPSPVLSGGDVPTVYVETAQDLALGSSVLDQKLLQFILDTRRALVAADLNLTDFVVRAQSAGDLEILAPEGWLIYLDTNRPPTGQIDALKRVLEQEVKEKRRQLEYVDLRVENRVYYKLKTP